MKIKRLFPKKLRRHFLPCLLAALFGLWVCACWNAFSALCLRADPAEEIAARADVASGGNAAENLLPPPYVAPNPSAPDAVPAGAR